MSSFTKCLRKAGLDKHEAAILRGLVKDRRDLDGLDAHAAAADAVRELMQEAHADRAAIVAQIREQTGIDVGEAAPLPEPVASKGGGLTQPAEVKAEVPADSPEETAGIVRQEVERVDPRISKADRPEGEVPRAPAKAERAPEPAAAPARQEPELKSEPVLSKEGETRSEPTLEGEPKIEGQGTLFGGVPLAPIAKGISQAFGWSQPQARSYLGKVSRFWGSMGKAAKDVRGPEGNPARNLAALLFDTSSGHIRSVLKGYKSPTAESIVDQFHAPGGEVKRAISQTFNDAVDEVTTKRTRQLSKALGELAEDEAKMEQVAALTRNPDRIVKGSKVHDAATGLRTLLDEMLPYMRDAGVDIGEIKKGYYPREFNDVAVLRDTHGFIDALAFEYRKTMKPDEALEAAKTLADHVLHGGFDTILRPDRGNVRAPFIKGRVFSKDVDLETHPLNKFLVSNPAMSVQQYINRAARRAEIARRFGDGFSKWADMSKKVVDEGGAGALDDLKDYVSIAAGLRRPGNKGHGMRAASMVRTWATLGLLEKATLSSLQEFITPAVRTGNWADVARSLRGTLSSLARTAKGKELRALTEDMNLFADGISDSIQAARFSGGEIVGMKQSEFLAKYFQRTGLEGWTKATIAGSVATGRVFIRRLAKRALAKERLARESLVELGISEKNIDAFAKGLLATRDGLPVAGEIMGTWGDQYRTAIRRFSSQSIMRPHATDRPKWANNPFGSVVFQLQSYNYAFWEHVLKRSVKMAGRGLNLKNDYLMAERLRLLAPMATLPLLYAFGGLVGEARDKVLGDPNRRRQETTTQKLIKAQSRSVPLAPVDPLINLISQARYSSSSANVLAGPALGTAGRGVDAALAAALHNSDNTNTQERKAWKTVYDLVLEPGANFALSGLHFGPASTIAAAAATQAVGAGATREAFVGGMAGPAKVKKTGPAKLNRPTLKR